MPEPCFIRSPLLEKHGFHGIFSLRNGGVSQAPFASLNLADDTGDNPDSVEKNLNILLRAAALTGIPHRAVQVHGHQLLNCRGTGRMHRQQADILLSQDGSPVAVRIADCTPVLIADPLNNRCAAIHAGWRGTAQAVVVHAVEMLQDAGGNIDNFVASIGPCIGPCCFEIGQETAAELSQSCTDSANYIEQKNGKIFADLAAINAQQLHNCGIHQQHIECIGGHQATCTRCHDERFFSFRRDGRHSGRHLAIVATKTPA
ncbi:MAG: peptidoglycan editing factor PgeF [Mariprofundaceae bacterium]|nr:peptidoglycan editing factor PgeF [Mariprofundaceae bacterium]